MQRERQTDSTIGDRERQTDGIGGLILAAAQFQGLALVKLGPFFYP